MFILNRSFNATIQSNSLPGHVLLAVAAAAARAQQRHWCGSISRERNRWWRNFRASGCVLEDRRGTAVSCVQHSFCFLSLSVSSIYVFFCFLLLFVSLSYVCAHCCEYVDLDKPKNTMFLRALTFCFLPGFGSAYRRAPECGEAHLSVLMYMEHVFWREQRHICLTTIVAWIYIYIYICSDVCVPPWRRRQKGARVKTLPGTFSIQ